MTKDEFIRYITGEVERICEVYDVKSASASVKLYTEGAEHDPVQKVDVRINMKGAVINQSAHSRSLKRAIDRALPDLERQVRKTVEKRRDKPRDAAKRGRRDAKQSMLDAAALAESAE